MSKTVKKISSGKGMIDGLPWRVWFFYTTIYVFGLSVLSGAIKHFLPEDLVYLFGIIPFDIVLSVWLFGLSFWAIITTILLGRIKRQR
jgi:hypothetical protein